MRFNLIELLVSFTFASAVLAGPAVSQAQNVPTDGSVLPFPPEPMAGTAARRLQDSTMQWPAPVQRLPEDAPNILIVLLDDVGFGIPKTFGGGQSHHYSLRLVRWPSPVFFRPPFWASPSSNFRSPYSLPVCNAML